MSGGRPGYALRLLRQPGAFEYRLEKLKELQGLLGATRAQRFAYAERLGKDRIAKDPGKYVNHIYGEKEIGGTSMLYLSGTPFEQLGFRTDLPQTPLPRYTMDVMEKVPWVLVTVASLLSGIAWWTHRTEQPELVQAPVEITQR